MPDFPSISGGGGRERERERVHTVALETSAILLSQLCRTRLASLWTLIHQHHLYSQVSGTRINPVQEYVRTLERTKVIVN